MADISLILAAVTLIASFANLSANPSPTARDPLCPYPSETTTYYSNPSDCSEFFECYEGRKYVVKCNNNLYWNQDKLECDYLENVNCNRNDPICAREADGTYLADPTDCSRYYECVDHKPLRTKCSPGTLWNQDVLNCDFPQNVKC